jgi:hypothetical protein
MDMFSNLLGQSKAAEKDTNFFDDDKNPEFDR